MSMNLALQKGKKVEWQLPYQTPTEVTRAALKSGNPTQAYKDWVLDSRKGAFPEETKEHFEKIDALIAEGYQWIQI